MRATLPKERHENAVNHSCQKETVRSWTVVAFDRLTNTFHEPIRVSWYMGRSSSASVVYCALWVQTSTRLWLTGKGKAGGGGYCKYSAALDEAIRSAGIEIDQHIHGAGDSACREALKAITSSAGFANFTIVE